MMPSKIDLNEVAWDIFSSFYFTNATEIQNKLPQMIFLLWMTGELLKNYHNKILMFFTFYFCHVKSLLRNNLIAMLFPYMVLMIHCCPVKTTPSWSNTWSLYISFFRSRPDEEKTIYKFKCGLKNLYSGPPHPDHSMQRLNIQFINQS